MNNPSEWSSLNPVEVLRTDFLSFVKKFFSSHSGNTLLVTTRGFTRRGLTRQITEKCRPDSLIVFDQVEPNPDLADIDEAIIKLRSQQIESIIAIGGGSVIDAAKALAAGICQPASLHELLIEKKVSDFSHRPQLIAIPTTAGTGSEVTPYATIWHHQTGSKYSLAGRHVFADQAILDPQLTLTLPENETLFSGLDCISHALESMWNHACNPISLLHAREALELATTALPVVLAKPGDLAAREKMQLASLFAGIAISSTKTAIAHALSYPLTAKLNIPHGLACSFTLKAIIENSENALPHDFLPLMNKTKGLLSDLELSSRIALFAAKEEILRLLPEMFDPSRILNFCLEANEKTVEKILQQSLK
ncbi:MAG: phosphonoacetaldehyde reductase [Candidatus Rifleibacteriota bacterium]